MPVNCLVCKKPVHLGDVQMDVGLINDYIERTPVSGRSRNLARASLLIWVGVIIQP